MSNPEKFWVPRDALAARGGDCLLMRPQKRGFLLKKGFLPKGFPPKKTKGFFPKRFFSPKGFPPISSLVAEAELTGLDHFRASERNFLDVG